MGLLSLVLYHMHTNTPHNTEISDTFLCECVAYWNSFNILLKIKDLLDFGIGECSWHLISIWMESECIVNYSLIQFITMGLNSTRKQQQQQQPKAKTSNQLQKVK